MSIQIHKKNGEISSVTIPYEEYQALLANKEDLEDIAEAGIIKSRIDSGVEEVFPFEIAKQITRGENPVKVYRKYRGFTQQQLADVSDVSRDYIAKIETGVKQGSVRALKKLAAALNLALDDIA